MNKLYLDETKEQAISLSRRLDKTSRVKPTIAFYSYLNKAAIFAESFNEKRAMTLFELNENVGSYIAQPLSFWIEYDSRKRRYTPDLLVKYKDGTYKFFEIKDSKGASCQEFKAKFSIIEKIFKEVVGTPIELLVRDEIQPGKSSANQDVLLQFRSIKMRKKLNYKIKLDFKSTKQTLLDLFDVVKLHKQKTSYAMAMLSHNEFTFDLTKMITHSTLLQVIESEA